MESHDAEFAAAPRPGAAATSLAAALAQLQAHIPPITKGADAQYGKYADLPGIHAVVFPLLAALGICWTCRPTMEDGAFVLRYRLEHAPTGEWIDGAYPLPTSGTPQQIGSAITYARRYALNSVLGIAPVGEDDDGQAAQNDAGTWHAPANPRTRRAVRPRGQLGDDEWTTEPAPDADEPGSITDAQGMRLKYLFTRAGITDVKDRLAYTMSKLDLPELGSSAELSMVQANTLIKRLEEDRR
jgi:hypothetical protein